MPRDSNGSYSLPPSNPVIENTQITPAWANGTLTDMATAISESLDRSGRGGMTGPFKVANGTVSGPGLSFTSQPNSGFYYLGPNQIGLSINGILSVDFSSVGATFSGRVASTEMYCGVHAVPSKLNTEPPNIIGQINLSAYESNSADVNLSNWCQGPFIRWAMPDDGTSESGTIRDSVLEISVGSPVVNGRPRMSLILTNEAVRAGAGEIYLRSQNTYKLIGDWNGVTRLSYQTLKAYKDDGSNASVWTGFDFDIANYANLTSSTVSFTGDIEARSLTTTQGVSIGTTLQVTDTISTNKFRMVTPAAVPSATGSPGSKGEVTYDSSFLYICVATDTWKRVALSTF